jgi:hypothetical protein
MRCRYSPAGPTPEEDRFCMLSTMQYAQKDNETDKNGDG